MAIRSSFLLTPASSSFVLVEMPIDNTDTERMIRDMVMGKNSYLFCRDLDACMQAGSDDVLIVWCLQGTR